MTLPIAAAHTHSTHCFFCIISPIPHNSIRNVGVPNKLLQHTCLIAFFYYSLQRQLSTLPFFSTHLPLLPALSPSPQPTHGTAFSPQRHQRAAEDGSGHSGKDSGRKDRSGDGASGAERGARDVAADCV